MEFNGIHLMIAGGAVFAFNLWGKIYMENLAKESYCTKGRVTGHETKFQRVGGTWTWMKYPTVEYMDSNNNIQTGFIKYAKSTGTFFSVGEEVDIVVNGTTIYYQHAMKSNNYKWIAIGLATAGLIWELYNWLS